MGKTSGFAIAAALASLAMPCVARAEDTSSVPSTLRGQEDADADYAETLELPKEPSARVHITSPRPVKLLHRPPGTTAWREGCTSPCDADLPVSDEYRITGQHLRASNDFKLDTKANGTVDLRVNPSTTGAWELGVIVGGGGLLVDAGAIYFFVISFLVTTGDCTSAGALVSFVAQGVCRGHPSPLELRGMSLIALIPGTLASIVGVSGAAANWSTRVETGTLHEVKSSAFLRIPERREPVVTFPDAAPSILFPLYSRSF